MLHDEFYKTVFLFLRMTEKKFYHDFCVRTIVSRDFERSASYCWWPFIYKKKFNLENGREDKNGRR